MDELVVAARPRPRLRLRRLGEEIEGVEAGLGKSWTGEERRANPR